MTIQHADIHLGDPESSATARRIEAALADLIRKANASMSRETTLLELAQANSDYSNRAAAAAAGMQNDLSTVLGLLEAGTVSEEALATLRASVDNAGALAAALEAMDSAYPAPEPTPTPEPEEPTEVPPVEDAPGTDPLPE